MSPLARALAAGGSFLALVMAIASLGAAGLATQSQAACTSGPEVEAGGVEGLPPEARRFAGFYIAAAEEYRLGERGPAILAAIHSIETRFGELNGETSSAGAIGHMQFMPETWEAYGVDADGDRERNPYDAEDAIHAAANLLRASGAPGDWERAIFAYNHAEWYVDDVLRAAERFGDVGAAADATTAECEGPLSGGPAELGEAVRVYGPARDVEIPARYMAPGFSPDPIDARIWPNVRWLLDTYELRVTAGKETGHASHGDGSAIDAVPAEGLGSLASWRQSVERAARDLGWSPGCASAGVRPACELVPAIEFVGYNGYDAAHGDPAHSGSPHVHISWVSATHGTAELTTPDWMLVFPSPGAAS